MPGSQAVRLTTDKREIHAFLQRDPVYAAYAIGDLEDAMFGDAVWYLAEEADGARGLVLLYHGLQPPILLTMGEPDAVAAALAAMPLPDRIYMAAQREHLPAIERAYDFSADRVRPMVRMALQPDAFRPVPRRWQNGALRRLAADDLPALEALYGHGDAFAPDAFHPRQVSDGVFYGVWAAGSPRGRDAELLAVAGTHLLAPTWGVAAVGNVYTHPAARGQGLARLVTSAVTAELLQRGLRVVLNVDQANAAAIHIYETLVQTGLSNPA